MRTKYSEHSFANYPTSFRMCKVSPTKICMQFNDAEIKLRVNANSVDSTSLPKGLECTTYIPVNQRGIEIGCTAVGCQMPTIEACQMSLVEAYRYYFDTYNDNYSQTYSKNFIDFIKQLQSKVNHLVLYMEKNHVRN